MRPPGIASLRAIPWVFAWAQNRSGLTAWYGVGTALERALQQHGREVLAEMARDWPFFDTLVNDVEMVLAKSDPGIFERYSLLASGVAAPEDIDKAMTLGYRHPMGPLRLTDLVGLDVRLAIAEHLHRELGSEAFRPPALMRRMVEEGKLGKKTGQGFYRWDESA